MRSGQKGYVFGCAACMLLLLLGAALCAADKQAGASPVFGFQQVSDLAAGLARTPFEEPEKIPEFLSRIDYDQWRDIRFDSKQAYWRKKNVLFELQFFHPGSIYNQPVKINVVTSEAVTPVHFSPDAFSYGSNVFKEPVPEALGFAGFRLHHPLNRSDYFDEVITFLGASYFRALGRNQQYGLSARALALDTGLEKGEEFPFFKEFWLIEPGQGQRHILIYALLDSPSLSGGYEFRVQPGDRTQVHVKAAIYLRRPVEKLGVAPLTSMFFYGENINLRPVDDFRPEVHDSDGLIIADHAGGRWFRPLRNPDMLSISTYPVHEPQGFGLVQRDLNYDHYQDLESYYNRRPSAWITPGANWGAGRVELIEIPTKREIHDNMVVFWVPARQPADSPIFLSYRIDWYLENPSPDGLASIVATRTSAYEDGKQGRRFLIEFQGSRFASMNSQQPLNAEITIGKGAHLIEQQIQTNPLNGQLRLTFGIGFEEKNTLEMLDKMIPPKKKRIDLKALLKQGDEVVSEIWHYSIEY